MLSGAFQLSDAPGASEKSTGLFDPDADLFRTTLYICLSLLFVGVLLGTSWEYYTRKKTQHCIHAGKYFMLISRISEPAVDLWDRKMNDGYLTLNHSHERLGTYTVGQKHIWRAV